MKRMRLPVTGYYQDKYLYPLSCEGLIMNFIEYGVNKPKCVAVNRRMKKKITWPYLKNKRLILENGKNKKGSFFLLLQH